MRRAQSRLSLVQQFSVLCLAALVAFAAAFAWLVSAALGQNMMARAREIRAVVIRQEFEKHFAPGDLSQPLAEAARADFAKRYARISLGPNIVRVTVWNTDCVVVWSDEPAAIGRHAQGNPDLAAALRGELRSTIYAAGNAEDTAGQAAGPIMRMYVPVPYGLDNRYPNVVEVHEDIAPLYGDVGFMRRMVWACSLGGFGALYVVLFGLILRASRQMEQQTKQLMESHEQLVQADRMASLGVLAAGVAHEINNPNQYIRANTAILEKAWRGAAPVLERYYEEHGDFSMEGVRYTQMRARASEVIAGVRDGSERIAHIVSELGNFSRRDSGRRNEHVDMNEVVRSAVDISRSLLEKSTARLEVDLHPDLAPVRGNRQRLEQVVLNLIINACQALPNRERGIRIRTRTAPLDGRVCVEVCDEGRGIAAEHLPRIKDPFFTTRREEGGTGLGLSISETIVNEHGGQLTYTSTVGAGTTAAMILPCTPPRPKGQA